MKKRNEDNHNSLGEPDDQLPAETLKMINELLERLHRLRDLNILPTGEGNFGGEGSR